MRAVEVHDLEDAVFVDVQRLGQLGDLRRPAELVHELVRLALDLVVDLLDPARLAHEQRVAQVMAQLAVHDGGGVGGEAHPALGVEALRRLDEAEIGHLEEILIGLAGVREPLEDVVQQVLVAPHDLVERAAATACRR